MTPIEAITILRHMHTMASLESKRLIIAGRPNAASAKHDEAEAIDLATTALQKQIDNS